MLSLAPLGSGPGAPEGWGLSHPCSAVKDWDRLDGWDGTIYRRFSKAKCQALHLELKNPSARLQAGTEGPFLLFHLLETLEAL